MKKILLLVLSLFLIGLSKPSISQSSSVTIGLIGTDCDQIIIQWNSTFSFVGSGNNGWVQSTFILAWPSGLGNTILGTIIPIAPGFTGWQYDGSPYINGANYEQKVILLIFRDQF